MTVERNNRRESELMQLGRLSAEVAHEIRNYLTPILANAELLCRNRDSEVSEAARRILANATLCRSFVQHILGGLAHSPPAPVTFDLALAIQDQTKTREGTSTISLNHDAGEPFTIEGIPSLLISVFENLFRNAEEAMPSDSGRIDVEFRRQGRSVKATVTDNGPGIPPEIQDTLFEEFETAGKSEGTGIGLSLARRVMSEHGGSITLKDSSAKGTTFELLLPFKEAEEGATSAEEGSVGPLRILCIDDDQSTLDTYRMILGLDNHQIETCREGKAGLALLAEEKFDVIICDLRMPDINGMDLHRQLGKSDPQAAESLIFVTGDLMNEESQAYLTAAQRPYLIKPFEIEELRVAIHVALKTKGQ